MDPNAIENTFDAVQGIPTYNYGNYLHQSMQQQPMHAPQNVLPRDYTTNASSNATTMIDVNNNNNFNASTSGGCNAAFHYFNETEAMLNNNNNNNNNSFSNQNYKISSKYAGSTGTPYPLSTLRERNSTTQCGGGIGLLGAVSAVNTMPCLYAHNFGGASCYNRNRYMPYNHNRACAAAAAAATSTVPLGMGGRLSAESLCNKTIPANNISIGPPQPYSSYVAPLTYPNFRPLMPQQSNLTAINVCGGNAASSVLNAKFNCNTPAECSRYQCNVFTNAEIPDLSRNIQRTLPHNPPLTSAPCTPAPAPAPPVNPKLTNSTYSTVTDPSQVVSLRLTNLDYTMEEDSLRKFLLAQLKPITPVVSLVFEDSNFATVTVPDSYFAKQVVANLHRKKIGHKRMVVSYTRDSSQTEANTLRCQVAGLLKDVPYNRLPIYKFRELFQSRFKTSISVLDLYTMRDICIINSDGNDEKYITLQPNLMSCLENSQLMEGLQHTVPYCTEHFKREQHKGWAEQEIEPLPNVFMTIAEIQSIIYPLLSNHHGDIPVSSLVHCIEGQLKIKIQPNDSGVNLEHLICCVQGIKIQTNNFGIRILSWFEAEKRNAASSSTMSLNSCATGLTDRGLYFKSADPLSQITREVIELVKMSPKSTMKFSRFIPAYHNHFGKQCRVADYGYTKLIELFEALSCVVQIMGDGENRQITLTHRTQTRRFTSDLLRILRSTGNKSVLLSELPQHFSKSQNRSFNITDYGVCETSDILNGLVNSNVVVITKTPSTQDIIISIPKRQQTLAEVAKTCVFAAEMVELLRTAPQYTILFQKLVRSYHYHFGFQCRLSDYGFFKLADLMEAIHGVVEMDRTNDEDRRIYLSPRIACRVFAEQCEELIRVAIGSSKSPIKFDEVLKLHKKQYGYEIQAETLGVEKITKAIELMPYVEISYENNEIWITCHNDDPIFRSLGYRACKHLLSYDPAKYRADLPISEKSNQAERKQKSPSLDDFIIEFNVKHKETLNVNAVKAMSYALEIFKIGSGRFVRISKFMEFVIGIVRLLEHQSMLLLSDIKSMMNCSTSTTFAFGYANLFTLLMAYPDIFIVNMGVTQESSEVRLVSNCELVTKPRNCNAGQKSFESLSKQLQPKSNSLCFTRTVLGENNNNRIPNINYNGPPPAKIRNIESQPSVMEDFNNNIKSNNENIYPGIPGAMNNRNLQNHRANQSLYSNSSSYNSTEGFSHSNNSSFLNSSFANISAIADKENSFNRTFNLNASLNSSANASALSDLHSSLIGGNLAGFSSSAECNRSNYSASNLWERRHDSSLQNWQQSNKFGQHSSQTFNVSDSDTQPPPMKLPKLNIVRKLPKPGLITENSLYEIVDSIQNGPPGTPMCDPPKPDSPPSHNMPYWIDPVWSSHNAISQRNNELITLKPSATHSSDMLPIVLSPYTLSKIINMNKVFNFECRDRKIT